MFGFYTRITGYVDHTLIKQFSNAFEACRKQEFTGLLLTSFSKVDKGVFLLKARLGVSCIHVRSLMFQQYHFK